MYLVLIVLIWYPFGIYSGKCIHTAKLQSTGFLSMTSHKFEMGHILI